MIGIIKVGGSFDGVCKYVITGSKDIKNSPALIVHTTMAGRTHRELAGEFAAQRELHPALGLAVAHLIVRPAEGEHLTPERWGQFMPELLGRLGYDGAPRVVALHTAAGGQLHAHAIASRVRDDGSVVPDSQSYSRMMGILRELETAYGLQHPRAAPGAARLTRAEEELATRLGEVPPRLVLLERLLEAIARSDGTADDYLRRLAELRVAARPAKDAGGTLLGHGYELLDHRSEMRNIFAGRQIRRDLG